MPCRTGLGTRLIIMGLAVTMALAAGSAMAEAKAATPAPPDYANEYYWTVRTEHPDKPYDVFYVHPTTYYDHKDGPNQNLDNQVVRATTEATTKQQTGVFIGTCNIYAPRYRQVNRDILPLKFEERDPYLTIAAQDVANAFRYYLKHYNQGRPFVIASHSQGSVVTSRFLKKHRDLVDYDKLIAAYLVGWTLTKQDIEEIGLPMGDSPTQNACLITWNTISKGGQPPMLFPGAHCVNPLSWTMTKEEQPKERDLYAQIDMGDGTTKKVPHFTAARCNDDGALEIPVPAMLDELDMSFGHDVYHRYDYDFFYGNFIQNVKDRCQAWSAKHKAAN